MENQQPEINANSSPDLPLRFRNQSLLQIVHIFFVIYVFDRFISENIKQLFSETGIVGGAVEPYRGRFSA